MSRSTRGVYAAILNQLVRPGFLILPFWLIVSERSRIGVFMSCCSVLLFSHLFFFSRTLISIRRIVVFRGHRLARMLLAIVSGWPHLLYQHGLGSALLRPFFTIPFESE